MKGVAGVVTPGPEPENFNLWRHAIWASMAVLGRHSSIERVGAGGGKNPRGPGQKGPERIRTMKICCTDNHSCVMSVDKVITYHSYTEY